jgi:hypothetical protein
MILLMECDDGTQERDGFWWKRTLLEEPLAKVVQALTRTGRELLELCEDRTNWCWHGDDIDMDLMEIPDFTKWLMNTEM